MKRKIQASDYITNVSTNTLYVGNAQKSTKCTTEVYAEDGSLSRPFRDIDTALTYIINNNLKNIIVKVSAGNYTSSEPGIELPASAIIQGDGAAVTTWTVKDPLDQNVNSPFFILKDITLNVPKISIHAPTEFYSVVLNGNLKVFNASLKWRDGKHTAIATKDNPCLLILAEAENDQKQTDEIRAEADIEGVTAWYGGADSELVGACAENLNTVATLIRNYTKEYLAGTFPSLQRYMAEGGGTVNLVYNYGEETYALADKNQRMYDMLVESDSVLNSTRSSSITTIVSEDGWVDQEADNHDNKGSTLKKIIVHKGGKHVKKGMSNTYEASLPWFYTLYEIGNEGLSSITSKGEIAKGLYKFYHFMNKNEGRKTAEIEGLSTDGIVCYMESQSGAKTQFYILNSICRALFNVVKTDGTARNEITASTVKETPVPEPLAEEVFTEISGAGNNIVATSCEFIYPYELSDNATASITNSKHGGIIKLLRSALEMTNCKTTNSFIVTPDSSLTSHGCIHRAVDSFLNIITPVRSVAATAGANGIDAARAAQDGLGSSSGGTIVVSASIIEAAKNMISIAQPMGEAEGVLSLPVTTLSASNVSVGGLVVNNTTLNQFFLNYSVNNTFPLSNKTTNTNVQLLQQLTENA